MDMEPKVGDRVVVTMVFDEVTARVLEVYGQPDHRYVLLAMPLLGASGEILDEYTQNMPLHKVHRVVAA